MGKKRVSGNAALYWANEAEDRFDALMSRMTEELASLIFDLWKRSPLEEEVAKDAILEQKCGYGFMQIWDEARELAFRKIKAENARTPKTRKCLHCNQFFEDNQELGDVCLWCNTEDKRNEPDTKMDKV